jgi:hypothetical protein
MMENLPMGEGRGELFENRHFHLNATNVIPLDRSVQRAYSSMYPESNSSSFKWEKFLEVKFCALSENHVAVMAVTEH